MDADAYFRSLTAEINALKDRIRNFIGDAHWLSDGLWKESVVKAILRRYFPGAAGIGTGFVITDQGPTTQIDVLIYDLAKPVLFRDGDFVIITADAAVGLIEVKTRIQKNQIEQVCRKIFAAAQLLRTQPTIARPFVGAISIEDTEVTAEEMLDPIYNVAGAPGGPEFNCLCLGSSYFVRYWSLPPSPPNFLINRWHAYRIPDMAPAYFIHNVIEFLFPQSVSENSRMWYPLQGKEPHKIGERPKQSFPDSSASQVQQQTEA
jgi:hypothetical protein